MEWKKLMIIKQTSWPRKRICWFTRKAFKWIFTHHNNWFRLNLWRTFIRNNVPKSQHIPCNRNKTIIHFNTKTNKQKKKKVMRWKKREWKKRKERNEKREKSEKRKKKKCWKRIKQTRSFLSFLEVLVSSKRCNYQLCIFFQL